MYCSILFPAELSMRRCVPQHAGKMPVLACADVAAIEERMRHIRHKILVLSGKGGVGKSTFSAQLAFALASAGSQVSWQVTVQVEQTSTHVKSHTWMPPCCPAV